MTDIKYTTYHIHLLKILKMSKILEIMMIKDYNISI